MENIHMSMHRPRRNHAQSRIASLSWRTGFIVLTALLLCAGMPRPSYSESLDRFRYSLRYEVAHRQGQSYYRALLVRRDLDRLQVVVITDFSDPTLGPLGKEPIALTVDTAGSILVVDRSAGTAGHGALFRVYAHSGRRILLSDFGDPTQGDLALSPVDVRVRADGSISIAALTEPRIPASVRFEIDPGTGRRSLDRRIALHAD
jgi:hypothetical protein